MIFLWSTHVFLASAVYAKSLYILECQINYPFHSIGSRMQQSFKNFYVLSNIVGTETQYFQLQLNVFRISQNFPIRLFPIDPMKKILFGSWYIILRLSQWSSSRYYDFYIVCLCQMIRAWFSINGGIQYWLYLSNSHGSSMSISTSSKIMASESLSSMKWCVVRQRWYVSFHITLCMQFVW